MNDVAAIEVEVDAFREFDEHSELLGARFGSGRRDVEEGPNPPSIEGVVRVWSRALCPPRRERRLGIVDPADPDQGLRGHQLELEVAARASRLLGEGAIARRGLVQGVERDQAGHADRRLAPVRYVHQTYDMTDLGQLLTAMADKFALES